MSELSSALSQAVQACLSQHLPSHCLYMVASPIGNVADVSVRALHALIGADAIACEDTRHSQTWLKAYGITKPASAWLAVHEHNEQAAAQAVIVRLQAGQRVAYLCDAGTPGISDPGARLVAAVRASGGQVMPIPGASSVTTLLSAAGELAPEGWLFRGFLPHKGQARTQPLSDCAAETRPQVLLESPHRIEALASALAALGQRLVSVGRELTKQFEEVDTVPCADLPSWLQAHPHRTKGEFVLLLHALPEAPADAGLGLTTLKVLMSELPLSQAARLAAQLTGESRKRLYDAGLALAGDEAQAQQD